MQTNIGVVLQSAPNKLKVTPTTPTTPTTPADVLAYASAQPIAHKNATDRSASVSVLRARQSLEAEQIAREFLTNTKHFLHNDYFSLNIMPKQHLIHGHLNDYYNIEERETYCTDLFQNLAYAINRHLHNNFQRYPDMKCKSLVSIEHTDKENKVTVPHMHCVVAVRKNLTPKFEQLLIKHPTKLLLNPARLRPYQDEIQSIEVKRFPEEISEIAEFVRYSRKNATTFTFTEIDTTNRSSTRCA
jgi:hypothetical protein